MNRLLSSICSPRLPGWIAARLVALTSLLAIAQTADGAAVIRGPYLQQGTPTNLIVRWRTDTPHVGRVRYGTSATNLAAFADESASATNHAVQLSNLAPDTVYFYSLGLAAQTLNASTNYFFRTAPPVASRRPFRVWVLGDFGFTNASAGPVRDAYSNFTSNRYTDLWLLLWLEADLQQNAREWTVAFWHHPPYSKGSNDSDVRNEEIEMRSNAVPILEAYGVDLVLSGHSHSYERSYLIDGHYGPSTTFSTNTMLKDGGSGRVDGTGSYDKPTAGPAAHEGTVYLVSGNGAS